MQEKILYTQSIYKEKKKVGNYLELMSRCPNCIIKRNLLSHNIKRNLLSYNVKRF